MDRRRILITGGAGFVGSNLAARLVRRREFALTVLDDGSAGLSGAHLPPGVAYVRGDCTDAQVLATHLAGVHSVVHLAARSGVAQSVADPVDGFHVNVAGSFHLLEAARRAGVTAVIAASTGGALLGAATPPISETMAPRPLSPYGASKMALEGYCSAYAASYGLQCCVLRFSNLYGPVSAHKTSAVAAFMKRMLAGLPLTVYGDGSQRRDYLFVRDLAAAIEQVLDQGVTGVFQLGSGRPTSLRALIAALSEVTGIAPQIAFLPARAWEVHSTWCDIGGARRAFGFDPATSLGAGLAQTWRWYRDNAEAVRAVAAVSSD